MFSVCMYCDGSNRKLYEKGHKRNDNNNEKEHC